jgi:hypothetical protein
LAFDLLVEDLILQKEYETEHGILTLDASDANSNHGFTLARTDEMKKHTTSCGGQNTGGSGRGPGMKRC